MFNKYGSEVSSILSDNPELLRLFESIKNYHAKNPEKSLSSVENLELLFSIDYPILSGKDKHTYPGIFERLREVNPDPVLIDKYLHHASRANLALELATRAVALSEGTGSVEDIHQILERIGDSPEAIAEDLPVVDDDLNNLLEKQLEKGGLNWRLDCLNRSLGPLRQGDFGFVFKRPETGGTTFLASEVSYFATQVDRPILWFNNEEQSEKVLLRCYQAVLGCDIHYLQQNREKCLANFKLKAGGKLLLPRLDVNFSFSDIERYCIRYLPSLVVVDQLDKVKGFPEERKDLEYGAIYRWARELSKRYCPVIGVSQASASAENKMWLSMDDIAESKTAKAAEADFILGIGAVDEQGKRQLRFFSICKNKLMGSLQTDVSLRHGRMTCIIEPEIARFRDI